MMGTQLVHNGKTTLYASHPLGNWGLGAIKLGDSTYKLLGVSNMIHISTDLGMEIKSTDEELGTFCNKRSKKLESRNFGNVDWELSLLAKNMAQTDRNWRG